MASWNFHKYVSLKQLKYLKPIESLKIITCHLRMDLVLQQLMVANPSIPA